MLDRFLSRPWVQRWLPVACLIGAAVYGYVIAFLRVARFRDFDVHREVGRRFLTGEYLYAGGYCHPYMPAAAMYFAPLAWFDRATGMALRYAIAVAALCLTFALLHRMVRARLEAAGREGFTLAALTVLLAFPFILQDLDDGGPHLILLAMLTGGIYAVWRGREGTGALWFGLATALKVTPALFLPLFLWKRQWRLAGLTAAAALFWIALPMVWMGAGSWWSHQKEWIEVAAGSFVGRDRPVTVENEQRVRNQSLRLALTRYLTILPEDHPLRRDDPAYVPMLDLSLPAAKTAATVAMAGLLALLGWHARRPYGGPGDPAWPKECSLVLILALLFSPVTWVQHLVWLVPALYLIVADARSGGGLGRPAWAALGAYVVLVDLLNYELLGKPKFAVLLSYHPFTVAMLLLFAILLADRPRTNAISLSANRHAVI
ncbi:MAG: glycosyltransferase family 87 protein [Nitrospirota bacterium]